MFAIQSLQPFACSHTQWTTLPQPSPGAKPTLLQVSPGPQVTHTIWGGAGVCVCVCVCVCVSVSEGTTALKEKIHLHTADQFQFHH